MRLTHSSSMPWLRSPMRLRRIVSAQWQRTKMQSLDFIWCDRTIRELNGFHSQIIAECFNLSLKMEA